MGPFTLKTTHTCPFFGVSSQKTLTKKYDDVAVLGCWREWSFDFSSSMDAERRTTGSPTFKRNNSSLISRIGLSSSCSYGILLCIVHGPLLLCLHAFVGPLVCCFRPLLVLQFVFGWSLCIARLMLARFKWQCLLFPTFQHCWGVVSIAKWTRLRNARAPKGLWTSQQSSLLGRLLITECNTMIIWWIWGTYMVGGWTLRVSLSWILTF